MTFEEGSQLKTIGGGYSSSSSYYYGAFSDCSALTSIEIPASVETIESYAFERCSSLATVTFEKGSTLKSIVYGIFDDCSSLERIEIPASVEIIKGSAFRCSSLTTVTFEKGSQLKTIGENAFYSLRITHIEIPASVETIESAAFAKCSSLTTVTFEKGSQLKTIGGGEYSYPYYDYGAFSDCPKLMTVDASACTSVDEIGENAFRDCIELRLFLIGTAVPPTCGGNAFWGINPYSVLKVPSGCADTYKRTSEWNNFASITGLDE